MLLPSLFDPGNLVYLHLSVAFIQMLKSLMPIVTMVVLFLAGLETPTLRVILAVSVITAGTALASVGELNYSAIGVAIMLASNVFEAMRVVATQVLLTGEKFHPSESSEFQYFLHRLV
jgi:drug/metabolite transporter (DMT)-like permease